MIFSKFFTGSIVDIRRDTNQSKLTFFLTFFQMENIERHLEQGKFFYQYMYWYYIEFDVLYIYHENILLVQACTQCFLKEKLFENRFLC